MRKTEIRQITPLERGLGVIDGAMRELAMIRQELAAQIPRRKAAPPARSLRDGRAGKEHTIRSVR